VLPNNTEGNDNTAVGLNALFSNTEGSFNTAIGRAAMGGNTTGASNTVVGWFALASNTAGINNTAVGTNALQANIGNFNNAVGSSALNSNTTGLQNSAIGTSALGANTTGSANTAAGGAALFNSATGDDNTAVGFRAGFNLTNGSGNVYIGRGMEGVSGENNSCYIRSIFGQTSANGIPVLINSANKLGTTVSSKRFKEDLKPMGKASEAIFALKPVAFRYKKEIDPAGTSQFGLVSEDVQQINPDLIVRDKEGKPYSVRYDQVNAMLLNEFLKEHRKIEAQQSKIDKQEATMTELKSIIAQQQEGMEVLAMRLEEHGSQIQKVSAQIGVSKPAPQTVVNNR
jgi:antitoxin component HigA of HigAB toxin-antitoxin module